MTPLHDLFPAISTSPQETLALGRQLGDRLIAGDVVALMGELGAGKTHFAKGIGAAWGVPEALVSSPTFTLLQEYAGTKGMIYHFDAYRIERLEAFFDLGYEEYFYGDGVCLIEWPEKVAPLLPDHTLCLRLSHLGDNRRQIIGMDLSAS